MARFEDLTGCRFNRWTVEYRVDNDKHGNAQYMCLCDCGDRGIVRATALLLGRSCSCGCYKSEQTSKRSYKHGESSISNGRFRRPTRLYRIWIGMINRCNNQSIVEWDRYGGRGICVCDEWRHDYLAFKNWAESNGYSDELTIDRIDNDGDYEPANCRWISFRDQMNNTSHNHLLSFNGKEQTMSEWARELNIQYETLRDRINKLKWPVSKALTTPVRKSRHDYERTT